MYKNLTTLFMVMILMVSDSQAHSIAPTVSFDDVAKSSTVPSKSTTEQNQIPDHFEVRQNYPNPFNATTTIEYDLPDKAKVYAVVYNIFLNRIKTLKNERQIAGRYKLTWDGTAYDGHEAASGVYIYVLVADNRYFIGKMVLLK